MSDRDGNDQQVSDPPQWQGLKLTTVRKRLAEVSGLLRQAAAVGLAQDLARMETLTELTERRQKGGDANRRRYR